VRQFTFIQACSMPIIIEGIASQICATNLRKPPHVPVAQDARHGDGHQPIMISWLWIPGSPSRTFRVLARSAGWATAGRKICQPPDGRGFHSA